MEGTIKTGDKVTVRREDGEKVSGIVKFVGKVGDKPGEWYGVQLDQPNYVPFKRMERTNFEEGKNDGSFKGRRYFECEALYGLFVKKDALKKLNRLKSQTPEKAKSLQQPLNHSKQSSERIIGEGEESSLKLNECSVYVGPSNALVSIQRIKKGWLTSPVTPQGILFDSSDRNILCMSVSGHQCVIGGADHGLKVFNTNNGKMIRELYTKKYGHTEWVGCVTYLTDGRILSGGLDSKLCLWEERQARCVDLLGHRGAITQVEGNEDGSWALSSSCDKTLILWNLKNPRNFSSFSGHSEHVLDFVYWDNSLFSGDRKGAIKLWDISTQQSLRTHTKHTSQITAMEKIPTSQWAISGDLRGSIGIWDPRISSPVLWMGLHPGGAINAIQYSLFTHTLLTASADKKIQVIDLRNSFKPLYTLTDHRDCVYSLKAYNTLAISGGGNGWVLVHDLLNGKCLYGLGANQHAVRSLECQEDRLVTAGDDGNAVVYHFE